MRRSLTGLAVLLAAAAPAAARERADLLIRNATVVDVAGGKVAPHQSVAVVGDTIKAVGPDASLGRRFAAARQVDATGKYVMPGLWDMHVHFGGGPELIEENKALLPIYVAYGVTTVRDCAADLSTSVLEWRDDVAKGSLLGPRIFTSGPKLEGYKPIWKGTLEVGTPAEVNAALDKLQAMKVDFIKITDNTLKPDIFLYALTEAKRRGLRTSAHTPYALTIEQAVDTGLNSIEHIDYLIKAGSPREKQVGALYAAGKMSYGDATNAFVDSFSSPAVRVHFDTGNIMLFQHPEHWIPILGQRIANTHFKEFTKKGTDHSLESFRPLLDGTTNWPAVMDTLEATGYRGYCTFEYFHPYQHYPEALVYQTSDSLDRILGRKTGRAV